MTYYLLPVAVFGVAGSWAFYDVLYIRWVQGLAEDLPAVAPGPHRLVTFGQSFHWTDERLVAETVYDMLESGGALALIVHTVTGPRPPSPGVPAIPHEEISWWVNISAARPPWRLICFHRLTSPVSHSSAVATVAIAGKMSLMSMS